jgi:hypothetical protein
MEAELVDQARWLDDHHLSPVDDPPAAFDRRRDGTSASTRTASAGALYLRLRR